MTSHIGLCRDVCPGFTLAEMMVVLLIMSVALACMAPVMTTRMKADRDRALANTSPWNWAQNNTDAYYGLEALQTAMIGQDTKGVGEDAKLIIHNNDASVRDMILFKHNGNALGRLRLNGNSLLLGDLTAGTELGANTVAMGRNVTASDVNSLAVGNSVVVSEKNSLAIGNSTNVSAENSIAIGSNAHVKVNDKDKTKTVNAIAIGGDTEASGKGSIAIGHGAKGSVFSPYYDNDDKYGVQTLAIGYNAVSTANYSIAIGSDAFARYNNGGGQGEGSIAIGYNAYASDYYSISIGYNANSTTDPNFPYRCSDDKTIAIGYNSRTDGVGSMAIGSEAVADSHALNEEHSSTAIGYKASAIASGNATAIGARASAAGSYSLAVGEAAKTTDDYGTAVGVDVIAGRYSTALGYGSEATGTSSTAIGYGKSTGSNSISIGWRSEASGYGAVAIGLSAKATAENSVGILATANTENSIVLGNQYFIVSVPGTLNLSKSPVISSDRRLKNVGKEFTSGLEKIRQIKTFNYTFKDDEKKTPRVGVIAQDLKKIFPNAVSKGADGFFSIRMEDMFYAVINAVKELDSRVTRLEKENKELRARLEKLEAKLK